MSTLTVLLIAVAVIAVIVAFSAIRGRHSAATNAGARGELGASQGSEPGLPAGTQTRDNQRDERRRGGCC